MLAEALGGTIGARAAPANEQNRAVAVIIVVAPERGADRGDELRILLPVWIVFPGHVQRADRVADIVEFNAAAHIDEAGPRFTLEQRLRRQRVDALYCRHCQNVLPFIPASPV